MPHNSCHRNKKGSRESTFRLPDRTQKSVIRTLNHLERRFDNIFLTMKSLTCDNGYEFLNSEVIERSALNCGKFRARLYFAHPYTAFERGSNENANRIIRRFIPKGSDISDYTLAKIQVIEDWMNQLPREPLGGKTALEAEQEALNKFAG